MMMVAIVWRCLALMAIVAACCHCYDGYEGESCPTSALTFNAALTPTVKFYEERKEMLAQALLRPEVTKADFVCLQEIWFEDDLHGILEEVNKTFPYHYSPIHHDIGELRKKPSSWFSSWFSGPSWIENSPCSATKFWSLFWCFAGNCGSAQDIQQCMVDKCRQETVDLSDKCRSCISLSSVGPTTAINKCAGFLFPGTYNRVNPSGLVVLSKNELSEVSYHKFHSGTMVERGYIEAQAKDGLTYFCTHLSAVMSSYFEVNTDFENYEAMQAEEISQLHNRASQVQDHVLLGDLNTGPPKRAQMPGQHDLVGEAEDSYTRLRHELGYLNPYLNMEGKCTYCSANPILVSMNKTHHGDSAIDHVLLSRDFPGDFLNAQRVLVDGNLSDHYGVRLDLDPCVLAP